MTHSKVICALVLIVLSNGALAEPVELYCEPTTARGFDPEEHLGIGQIVEVDATALTITFDGETLPMVLRDDVQGVTYLAVTHEPEDPIFDRVSLELNRQTLYLHHQARYTHRKSNWTQLYRCELWEPRV